MSAADELNRLYSLLGDAVLLPIPLRTKAPDIIGWQHYTFAECNSRYQSLLYAASRGGNIGVLLGPASGRLFALDLDEDSLVDQWLNRHPWLADTLRSKAKRGCQFWLRLEPGCDYPNGKAVYKFNAERKPPANDKDAVGELRLGGGGLGAQSVIFGVHPDGMNYQILVDKPPKVVSLADLDDLAPGLIFADKDEEIKKTNPPKASVYNGPVPTQPSNIMDCVRRYLDKCEPAIEGQCGDHTTFRVLCHVIRGFDLSPEQAWEAALYYSQKCEPEWSEKELRHKVDDAIKKTANEPRGELLQGDGETPLSRKLKQEQAQRDEAEDARLDGQDNPAGAPIDLEKETQERIKRYSTDPEPFPDSMQLEGFHGLIGEIAKIMGEHCEASPEVLLIHGLIISGNIIGRSAYVNGGGSSLFANEFAVFIGETARGRKGTALRMWERLIELVNPDWAEGCTSGQLQSGEGLVHRIRDSKYGPPPSKKIKKDEPVEDVLLDSGVSDKRLLVIEEEFSHMSKMGQRNGNTLSETLRKAWDSPRFLRNDNKNSPLRASDPHISLIGHTTREELAGTLKPVELENGMANRVLWCAARRTRDMPNAEILDWRSYPDILDRLKAIFRQRLPNTDDPAFFPRTDEAKSYWDHLYRKLNSGKSSSVMDKVLGRDTSHILKAALIFAVVDRANKIGIEHLKAAVAVINFCQASARWVFGKSTGNKLANNILWALRRSPKGLTRTEIQKTVCYGKTPETQIDRALTDLYQNTLAAMKMEKNEKGRPTERWLATA